MITTQLPPTIRRVRPEISVVVRRWMTRVGKIQTEVARASGLSDCCISNLVNGKVDQPPYDVLIKLSRAFGIHPGFLDWRLLPEDIKCHACGETIMIPQACESIKMTVDLNHGHQGNFEVLFWHAHHVSVESNYQTPEIVHKFQVA